MNMLVADRILLSAGIEQLYLELSVISALQLSGVIPAEKATHEMKAMENGLIFKVSEKIYTMRPSRFYIASYGEDPLP